MVKDHSDSERGNPLMPHRLLFPWVFYIHHPTDRIAHTTAFVTPVVEHWLEWEIAQWVHPMKDRSDDPSHHEQTLLPRSYISLQTAREETHCCLYMGYSFWLSARDLLYASSLRQDRTCYDLCYTSCGALARTTNSSMGPPWRIDPKIHCTRY